MKPAQDMYIINQWTDVSKFGLDRVKNKPGPKYYSGSFQNPAQAQDKQ